ncbi:MAG TPA: OmpA family protein [Gammaproteobacteria bacterium]
MPERIETLEQARAVVESLERDPLAQQVAPTRLNAARQSLAEAEQQLADGEPVEDVDYHAYLALRNAQIAEQMIGEERARNELQDAEAERSRVLLQAREQEARQAQSAAQQAQTLAEQRAGELEQQSEQARQAQARADELEQQLADLEAQQTERGLVLTLSDVLFDTARAELKPGAATAVDRIAEFMSQYPERRIIVEGHTDSRGTEEYNRRLSEERADAVRDALLDRGISSERIEVRGLGESYPVASNDTSAGQQLNRRVEVVISDDNGRFAPEAQRQARSGRAEE